MPPNSDEITEIVRQYESLYNTFETKTSPDNPILLAHYTSVQVVEQILKNNEIWLANPLYMNDLEEMRVGVLIGNKIFPEYAEKVGGTSDRSTLLTNAYNHYLGV